MKSVFKTVSVSSGPSMSGSADHEHADTNLSVKTAQAPDETASNFARLPGQVFNPAMSVANRPNRGRV
jgi:hypothetical protein